MWHSRKIAVNFLHRLGLEAARDFFFGNADCILQH